jgi:acyl carrier protein
MDSLDIVNFRNRVQATFDVSVPLFQFMDQNQTVNDLIKKLEIQKGATSI